MGEGHLCSYREDEQGSLPFSVIGHIWYFDRAVVQNVWHQVQPCDLQRQMSLRFSTKMMKKTGMDEDFEVKHK